MKLDLLCNDGSPLGVTPETIYGDDKRVGVGGAELALLTLAEYWKSIGHDVRLYNNPWYVTDKLEQLPIAAFNRMENRDALIVFRSPNVLSERAKGKKIWWSCDQSTIGNFREFGNSVDEIVTISPNHRNYFKNHYALDSTVIDLPIREQDYAEPLDAIPYRLLFSSVPDRGLDVLAQCWPGIKKEVPEASLVITSDYRLWGALAGNGHFRSMFFGKDDVTFLGAVSRNKLIEEQWKAEILSYPCTYDELFCYAVAEAEYTGTLPITTTMGSLPTTNLGICIDGDFRSPYWKKNYVNEVVSFLNDRTKLSEWRTMVRKQAQERFSLEKIGKVWEEEIFNG